MGERSRTILTVLAIVLALWLILGFWPLTHVSQLALSLCVLITGGAVFWFQWGQYRKQVSAHEQVAGDRLPPENFPGAVVLVCGDTAPLFPQNLPFRETHPGWYLNAQSAEHLPGLAQHLAAVRPELVSQVSVLLAVIPEQHTSEESFTQSLRGWHRSIVQCRRWLSGIPPVWCVTWASPPDNHVEEGDGMQWFTVTPDLPGIRARQHGHVALPVTDWQRESGGTLRFSQTLWLDRLLALTAQYITPLFRDRQGELPPLKCCAAGICLTPVSALPDNLLQQHTGGITTLRPLNGTIDALLPLPDVLLPHLPRRRGISRRMQDIRLAGGMCFFFLALAMLASFVNNQRLAHSVGDHLALYHHLSGTPPAPKLQVQQRLRADSRLLDDWLRRSEPLRYGLGLYQGLRLIPPVEAAISDWSPPPQPRPVIKRIIRTSGPQTVRLDSMSLFDTGRWQLKPGSTKVLVNALVDIKAKQGWLIVVSGYTDNTGDDRSNQVLSLKRAESVRDWMRDTGDVPESCFAVQGYGESRPAATNDTPEGRALNRRVEISLVPQTDACQAPEKQSVAATGDINKSN